MARIAGRNTPFSIVVGVICASVIIGLIVLAAPAFPASAEWLGDMSAGLMDLIRSLALS